jgi:hypothetical protein
VLGVPAVYWYGRFALFQLGADSFILGSSQRVRYSRSKAHFVVLIFQGRLLLVEPVIIPVCDKQSLRRPEWVMAVSRQP